MTADLVAFLRARLDEDERGADDVHDTYRCASVGSDPSTPFRCDCPWPARVLAEVAAKRAILELHEGSHECSVYDHRGAVDNCAWVIDGGCSTVRLLMQPYAGHPHFHPSWSAGSR